MLPELRFHFTRIFAPRGRFLHSLAGRLKRLLKNRVDGFLVVFRVAGSGWLYQNSLMDDLGGGNHPSRAVIEKYCDSPLRLPGATVSAIENHLMYCSECCLLVNQTVRCLVNERKNAAKQQSAR